MKIGKLVKSNKKGQIVIPKDYRDKLNITEDDYLNIFIKDQKLVIEPVEESSTDYRNPNDELFDDILKEAQGSWAGDNWPEEEKKRRKIELRAAKRLKETTW